MLFVCPVFTFGVHAGCAWLLSRCSGCQCRSCFLAAVKLQFLTLLDCVGPFWSFVVACTTSEMSCFCLAWVTLVHWQHVCECVVKVKADSDEDADEDAKQQQEHMWTLDEEIEADCMQR